MLQKLLRKCNFLILLLGIIVLSACGKAEPASYPLLGGSSVSLTELRGKIVLINYWAEWCRPCRIEIPELNDFARKYPDQVRVLSVNFDGISGDLLLKQVAALGIEFDTLLKDPRDFITVSSSGGLPETIVLDRNGNVQQVLLGPQNSQDLEALLTLLPPL